MNRFYAIAVLFAVCVGLLIWLRIKRENNAVMSSYLRQAFPRFMIFLVVGIAILVAIIWLIDTYEVYQRFGGRPLALLAIVLALPVYFISRRLEPADKRIFNRRSSIILFVFILPVVAYWALIEGMDPVLITVAAFIGSIVSIVLLSWSLWRD